MAEVCETFRPDWDGEAVTAVGEAFQLATSVPAVALLFASALAVRFKAQWMALAVVVCWTVYVTVIAMPAVSDIRLTAAAEGCVGSPALFIAAVAAICIWMIYTTGPIKKRSD